MKTFIIASIIAASLSLTAKADYYQPTSAVTLIAADVQSPALSQLLSLYYNIKNALVSSNANAAATQAGEFVKAINGIDMKALSEAEMNAFMLLQEKLIFDAKHISESKEIGYQRDQFKSFSDNLYKLAKAVKLSDQPIYQDYCPMKKAYWLSSETAIKNPYFGNQMLTCGKVNDTIK